MKGVKSEDLPNMGIGASKRGGLWHVNPQCLNLVRPSKSPHL